MPKMYYSKDETLQILNCSEEQLRAMVRDQKLKEFRDAGKVNYRVDEVDALARGGPDASGDQLTLDDGDEISLSIDDGSGEIPLAPAEDGSPGGSGVLGGSDAPIDLGASDSNTAIRLEDSSTASELELEDSDAAPAIRETKPAPGGSDAMSLDEVDHDALEGMKKDDTVITNIGISVFDEEDLEISADPMAKTVLTGDEGGALDGSAAGSGLLDLTRINDETSLGAELLDEIDMGGSGEATPPAKQAAGASATEPDSVLDETAGDLAAVPLGVSMLSVSTIPAASPAFTGLLIAAAIVLTLCGAMVIALSMQTWPDYLTLLAQNFWFFLLGTVLLGGAAAGIGYLVGKQATAVPRPPKAKKSKKGKKGQKDVSSESETLADDLLEEMKA